MKVCNRVKNAAELAANDKFGTNVNPRTVQKYVHDGKAEEALAKKGPDVGIPNGVFDVLLKDFISRRTLHFPFSRISKIGVSCVCNKISTSESP